MPHADRWMETLMGTLAERLGAPLAQVAPGSWRCGGREEEGLVWTWWSRPRSPDRWLVELAATTRDPAQLRWAEARWGTAFRAEGWFALQHSGALHLARRISRETQALLPAGNLVDVHRRALSLLRAPAPAPSSAPRRLRHASAGFRAPTAGGAERVATRPPQRTPSAGFRAPAPGGAERVRSVRPGDRGRPAPDREASRSIARSPSESPPAARRRRRTEPGIGPVDADAG